MFSSKCYTNALKIHYHRTGGKSPSLILLHGLICNGLSWSLVALKLQDNFDVIMPDARGHGLSDHPKQGYSYDDHADDVFGLVDTLALSNTVLVGHSMGGMTAAVVASQNHGWFKGLVLVDPSFLSLEKQHEVYKSEVVKQHCEILQQSKDKFLQTKLSIQSLRSEELIKQLVDARFNTSVEAFEVLCPPNPPYKDLIRSINKPTLLVIGGAKGIISKKEAEELSQINPLIQVVQIAEAGHGIPYDQPKKLADLIQKFVDSL